jgi:undecaprenol kinase
MGLHDKRTSLKLLNSFSFALSGIVTALRTERNMRIHLFSAMIVLFVSVYFSITKTEWLFILLAIGGMFVLEIMNTAIERVVDLVTEECHPLAKQAKDLAAGAVLVYTIIAVIIGVIIFLPYVLRLV